VPNSRIEIMLRNIKVSPEGSEFIEYLKELSQENYKAFVKDDSSMNDIHKGYAIAIDSLIHTLEVADTEPTEHIPVTDF